MNDKITRIKEVLKEKKATDKKFTQKYLADNLGLSTNFINDICNNKTYPNLKLLKRISIFLNVDIRTLLNPTIEGETLQTIEQAKIETIKTFAAGLGYQVEIKPNNPNNNLLNNQ